MPDTPSPIDAATQTTVTAADHVSCTQAIPLNELKTGQKAVIDRLELSEEDDARVLRLGLTPGRKIQLVRGGPRPIVGTAGARIALDRVLARGIQVVVPNPNKDDEPNSPPAATGQTDPSGKEGQS